MSEVAEGLSSGPLAYAAREKIANSAEQDRISVKSWRFIMSIPPSPVFPEVIDNHRSSECVGLDVVFGLDILRDMKKRSFL